jgi:hypothetical protein
VFSKFIQKLSNTARGTSAIVRWVGESDIRRVFPISIRKIIGCVVQAPSGPDATVHGPPVRVKSYPPCRFHLCKSRFTSETFTILEDTAPQRNTSGAVHCNAMSREERGQQQFMNSAEIPPRLTACFEDRDEAESSSVDRAAPNLAVTRSERASSPRSTRCNSDAAA